MYEAESNPEPEVPDPISWVQLAVMVNDGSGSMTLEFAEPDGSLEGVAPSRTKAAAVESALREFLNRMKDSAKARNFCFSFVSFNDNVTDRRPPRGLDEISTGESFDPTANGIGGTAIHRGLDAAGEIVTQFMQEAKAREVPASAVVVLMSDGEERDDPAKTADSAERLKGLLNTELAACLFATKDQPAEGGRLLEAIVSEPQLYQRVYNTEQLRSFFHASITATRPALPPGEE